MASESELPPGLAAKVIPTLTEVVEAPAARNAWAGANRAIAGAPRPPIQSAEEAICRLQPKLDARVAEAVSRALQDQLRGLRERVEQAVAEVVREAIRDALADDLSAGRIGR